MSQEPAGLALGIVSAGFAWVIWRAAQAAARHTTREHHTIHEHTDQPTRDGER